MLTDYTEGLTGLTSVSLDRRHLINQQDREEGSSSFTPAYPLFCLASDGQLYSFPAEPQHYRAKPPAKQRKRRRTRTETATTSLHTDWRSKIPPRTTPLNCMMLLFSH